MQGHTLSHAIEPMIDSAERNGEPTRHWPFRSFWMGGFESACQINTKGERIDMIAATHHDVLAHEDYGLVRSAGMRTVRDGIRWPLVERRAGEYDWSSFLPMVRAARENGVQVIWNLLHYGWPLDIDITSEVFIERFAKFCGATARLLQQETDEIPVYVPVNEISFLAWSMSVGAMQPVHIGCGNELKRQLVRASIAAMDAIWEVDPRARFVHVDPVIHVVPPLGNPELADLAVEHRSWQFEAWDMISGRRDPELGGTPRYLDIVGTNFYHSNQWDTQGQRIRWEDEIRDERWVPLNRLLEEVHQRYGRPLIISETSHVGVGRAKWLAEVAEEIRIARERKVPVEGICLYPIIDRPDWDDAAHWHNSGLWDLRMNSESRYERVLCNEYFQALQLSQRLLSDVVRS